MSVSVTQAEVFFCVCAKCKYEWKAFQLPKRCAGAGCKTTAWNRDGQVIKMSAPVASADPEKFDETIVLQSPAEVLPVASQTEEWSPEEKTISRKMGHTLGCDCIHCERMRAMFQPKKEEKPADKPAKKFPRKKKK